MDASTIMTIIIGENNCIVSVCTRPEPTSMFEIRNNKHKISI